MRVAKVFKMAFGVCLFGVIAVLALKGTNVQEKIKLWIDFSQSGAFPSVLVQLMAVIS